MPGDLSPVDTPDYNVPPTLQLPSTVSASTNNTGSILDSITHLPPSHDQPRPAQVGVPGHGSLQPGEN